MADFVKQILHRPIQLANQVTKFSDETELKVKTEKMASLLRQAARARNDLYERPTRRIIDDTEQVLEKAFVHVMKCRGTGIMSCLFTIIPAGTFRKVLTQLENSIGDVSWLLRVSATTSDRDNEYLGLFLLPLTSRFCVSFGNRSPRCTEIRAGARQTLKLSLKLWNSCRGRPLVKISAHCDEVNLWRHTLLAFGSTASCAL